MIAESKPRILAATLVSAALAVSLSGQSASLGPARLSAEANEALGLARSSPAAISIVGSDFGLRVGVVTDGAPLLLDLAPYSVRADDFQVRAYGDEDTWVTLDPGPVTTYRGSILGDPGSVVAASVLGDGLHARIIDSSARELWIEPLARVVPSAQAGEHVLYETTDVIDIQGTCEALYASSPIPYKESSSSAQYGAPGTIQAATANTELACDADYEFFQAWGSGTQARIESIVNTVNLQYQSDVDISHAITTIIVRTTSNDPYTKKPADQLLFEFRAEWNNNQSSVPRDVAHLFTGRNLSGSTIGIAWVGVVCNLDLAYSLVESNFNSAFACATDLSAHELGHNWGAGHCSCTSYTMNAYITCANQFNPSGTIPAINSYKNSVSCFGGPVDPPEDPVSIHVGSINLGTQGAGKGKKRGTATVSIVTDTGSAEAGAQVTGTFSGDFNESVSGTTSSSGTVLFTTTGTKKGSVNLTFCVDSVSGSLPYVSADNAETCDSL